MLSLVANGMGDEPARHASNLILAKVAAPTFKREYKPSSSLYMHAFHLIDNVIHVLRG